MKKRNSKLLSKHLILAIVGVFIKLLLICILLSSYVSADPYVYSMPSSNEDLISRSVTIYNDSNPVPIGFTPSYFYVEGMVFDTNMTVLPVASINVSLIGRSLRSFTMADGRVFGNYTVVDDFSTSGNSEQDGYFFIIVDYPGIYNITIDGNYSVTMQSYVWFTYPQSQYVARYGDFGNVSSLYSQKDLQFIIVDGIGTFLAAIVSYLELIIIGIVLFILFYSISRIR